MNVVMIIPTGIGCEIGGHAGDATPAARLLGSVCDKLILHPNVVNASDINEMPVNSLYVEGSMLDRFLEGKIELQEVKQNKILVAINSPVHNETVNAVSAARTTLGINAEVVVLKKSLELVATFDCGCATGNVFGWEELVEQVQQYEFDALAIASPIEVDRCVASNYWENGGVNPWGGVEAKASKFIASALNKPVAHAPVERTPIADIPPSDYEFICDPRMAPEIISMSYLFCVLKGLHKAPRIGDVLSVKDVDVMISPYGCWGIPHRACNEASIPIIAVKENKTAIQAPMGLFIPVENYIEAAGYIAAMKAGISIESLRRPLANTRIHND